MHNTSSRRLIRVLTDPPLANREGRIQQSASEHYPILDYYVRSAGQDDAATQRLGSTVVHLRFHIVEATVIVYSATR